MTIKTRSIINGFLGAGTLLDLRVPRGLQPVQISDEIGPAIDDLAAAHDDWLSIGKDLRSAIGDNVNSDNQASKH